MVKYKMLSCTIQKKKKAQKLLKADVENHISSIKKK